MNRRKIAYLALSLASVTGCGDDGDGRELTDGEAAVLEFTIAFARPGCDYTFECRSEADRNEVDARAQAQGVDGGIGRDASQCANNLGLSLMQQIDLPRCSAFDEAVAELDEQLRLCLVALASIERQCSLSIERILTDVDFEAESGGCAPFNRGLAQIPADICSR